MSVKKIIFLNQKGGVGKTTTAVNLGSALAKLGKKVLLVDLDAQGNLTSAVSGDNRAQGTYEVIAGQCLAMEACQKTSVKNLYVMAANINMAGLNIELVDQDTRELFVKKALDPLDDHWDYILADCPPSLGLVTVNAMCWAQYVIIPMQCEYFAMEGLTLLMRTITNIKKSLNPSLEVLGILFTMYSKRTKLANDVVEDISSYFSSLVFATLIPRNVRVAEAPSHGIPINVYDQQCSGAKAYQKLAQEVVKRVSESK
jgi:chromosome partitioning protein